MSAPTKTTLSFKFTASLTGNAAPIVTTLSGVTDDATAKAYIEQMFRTGGVWLDPAVMSVGDPGTWIPMSAIQTISYVIS